MRMHGAFPLLGVCLVLTGPSSALGQQQTPPSRSPAAFGRFVTPPVNAELKRKLEAANDYIKEGDWAESTKVLQSLLDNREDAFVTLPAVAEDGKETTHLTSMKAEACRLLGTLPPKGLEFYEAGQGAFAKAMLAEAREKNNPEILAQIGQRYLHTAAGMEAMDLLATYHLDRGRFLMSAVCFERLLRRREVNDLPEMTLFRASIAFRRAGDTQNSEHAWKLLTGKAPTGVRINNKVVDLDDLRKEIERRSKTTSELTAASEWSLYRGDVSRSTPARLTDFRPQSSWQRATIGVDPDQASAESIRDGERRAEPAAGLWLKQAVQSQESRSLPVLSGSYPISTGGKVIYHANGGICAVNGRTGKLLWESASIWNAENLEQDPSRSQDFKMIAQWVNSYLVNHPHVLHENSLTGTLSTDGNFVYAIEDLPVPPNIPVQFAGNRMAQAAPPPPIHSPELKDALGFNRLLAINVKSGKVTWTAGDPSGQKASQLSSAAGQAQAQRSEKKDADYLHDTYFLGPPLPLGGRLYVLTEKNQDLRVLCIDPAKGKLLWGQTLAMPRDRLLVDTGRRLQAAPLAYGEGILVCPTNAGAVVGVDLLSHSLVWAYAYREEIPLPEPLIRGRGRFGVPNQEAILAAKLQMEWKACAPIIHDGKVILTAPDDGSIHCLKLRDGSVIWKSKREADDVYVAGVAGNKVVVVGKQNCRALSLAEGQPAWSVPTGMPSGLGVLSAGSLYLPLRSRVNSKEPEICVIDLERGVVRAHFPATEKDMPGNLVLCGDMVISQTVKTVSAYPRTTE